MIDKGIRLVESVSGHVAAFFCIIKQRGPQHVASAGETRAHGSDWTIDTFVTLFVTPSLYVAEDGGGAETCRKLLDSAGAVVFQHPAENLFLEIVRIRR